MSSYYANTELDAYSRQLANYEHDQQVWQQTVQAAQAAHAEEQAAADAAWQAANEQQQADYETAHGWWEQNPTDPEGNPRPEPPPPEPLPQPVVPDPVLPPEPHPPDSPAGVYEARQVTGPEELATVHGPILVFPPRLVLTDLSDGSQVAIGETDLEHGYTPTSDPLPPAAQR